MDMILKIRPLAFVLLMIMLFSSVVSGQDKPNLIIPGIWQTPEDQAANREYAKALDAFYVEAYYSEFKNNPEDLIAVDEATPSIWLGKPVYNPTDRNGLTSNLLDGNGDQYGTIYAHSGGARTAVTALLYQGVTADRLVLISPARGINLIPNAEKQYNKDLQELLDNGIVKEIVVYQSDEDKPTAGNLWQGKFKEGDIRGNFRIIPVTSEQLLGKTGDAAHIQMWATALNLELGRTVEFIEGDANYFEEKPEIIAYANTENSAAPNGVTISTSGGNFWRYGNHIGLFKKGQWIEAACTYPATEVGIQFWGDANDGWARVLVDGIEVWTGDTCGLNLLKDSAFKKYLQVSGLPSGSHTVRVENMGIKGSNGVREDVHVYFFGFGAAVP
jgi:hypothetical protein